MNGLIVFAAKYLILVPPLLLLAVWFRQPKKAKLEMVVAAIISGVIAVILIKLAGKLYDNPRPFVSDGTPALFGHGNDDGFPSDHAALAMTLTTVLYFYHRQLAAVALLATLLIAIARVAAHVHHGIDVIAGIAIGALAGAMGYWLTQKLLAKSAEQGAVDKQDN